MVPFLERCCLFSHFLCILTDKESIEFAVSFLNADPSNYFRNVDQFIPSDLQLNFFNNLSPNNIYMYHIDVLYYIQELTSIKMIGIAAWQFLLASQVRKSQLMIIIIVPSCVLHSVLLRARKWNSLTLFLPTQLLDHDKTH